MSQISIEYLRKELFQEIEVTKRILQDTSLCYQATGKELARMEGMLTMAFMCDVITIEEKNEISTLLCDLHNQQRSVSL